MAATTEDERAQIEAVQADLTRFGEVYDRYVDRVCTYVSRRVGSRVVAEDVTSEVFQQALANLARFEWRDVPFAAWLFRIVANAIANHWRRSGREAHEPLPDVPDEREHEDLQRRVSLFQLVGRLPDLQRRVIEMRFVEERSILLC